VVDDGGDGIPALHAMMVDEGSDHSDACFRLFNKNWGIPSITCEPR
jgi:hypothetical protein